MYVCCEHCTVTCNLRITSFLVYDLLDYVARTRTSVIRRPILVVTQTSGYFYDPYNSRDLNPTEPMNHGCGSRRE